ncbi:MAG: glycosyltransferase family 4 protein [Anaerolineales bacterium]|jgi:glycosyltransferase involved in cell wall biosynthesis
MDDAGECVRILYFTRAFSPHDERFLNSLADTEHEIHYLPLLDGGSHDQGGRLNQDVKVHPSLIAAPTFSWLRYARAVRELRARINEIKPDLVHAGPIHLSSTITALTGFHPLASMSWGSDLLWETRKAWVALAVRYALQRSDVFIGDCQAVKSAAIEFRMNDERIVLFPWGIDLDHFRPGNGDSIRQALGWEDAFILLSTRSFEPLYGVDLILQAFIMLAPEIPSLRLLILGGGSQESTFKECINQAGLQHRAHFAGHLGKEELPDYYRASDLYLSASYSDGSSVSLLEAMGCGLPVLVSDIPGNCEWVEVGQNGWRFKTGDVESLVEGIRRSLEFKGELKQIGNAGRKVVEARADWHKNIPKLLEAYQIAREHAKRAA